MTPEETQRNVPILAIAIGAGALVAMAIVAFVAVATGAMMDGCGGMGGCHGRGGGAAQTPATLSGEEVTIEISDFDFSPREATISAGTTVTWTNRDTAPHDATDNDDAWETETLRNGDAGAVTFDEPGAFEYHCSIHPYMKATLKVRD